MGTQGKRLCYLWTMPHLIVIAWKNRATQRHLLAQPQRSPNAKSMLQKLNMGVVLNAKLPS